MGVFDHFPYTNFHELNLDWVLRMVREMNNEIDDFINLNSIKYANPFEWNITSQYEKNTLTIDPETGIVYLSVQAVPSGVSIENTDYWTPVFSLRSFYDDIEESISKNNEGSNTNASKNYEKGDWVWLNDELYIILMDIIAGTQFIENVNVKRISVEEQTVCIYYPNDKKLAIHGKISDYSQIVTTGDYHIYTPQREAIEIKKVE